jgi:transcriptional regulator with XRE-family HTH domain
LAGEAKRLRLERGVSLHRLSAITGYSRPHVREVERADARVPSPTVVAAVDKALGAGGHLSALRELAYAELQRRREEQRTEALEGPVEIHAASQASPMPAFTDLAVTLLSGTTYSEANDMHRRTLLLGLGGTALGLEAARHGLALSTAEDRATTNTDEWQEIVSDYGYAYQTASPRELLDSLTVDVLAVQYALARNPEDATMRDLRRAAAFLAAFMAMTIANLGWIREARRWWRTATRAADESGDVEASLWVRGWAVVRSPYEQCPLPIVLQLAGQAEARISPGGTPPSLPTLPQLYAGKAQSLALAGRHAEAADALEQARERSTDLPADTASYHDSLFGWADVCLHFAESFVFSYAGDVERADEAQRRAIAL